MAFPCGDLVGLIRRLGYEVRQVLDEGGRCVVDFRHPRVRVERPVSYFLSSAVLDKGDGSVEVTVRSRVDGVKELYLWYCCEDGVNVCRPHFDAENDIVSVEARFHKDAIKRLEALLSEML